MEIELVEIPIKEVADGYFDNAATGQGVGYSGKLNIRPPYQREFVYKDDKRNAVIDTVFKNFPLNVMYWAENDDGTYEVLDGQQRTISLCQYSNNDFSVKLNGDTLGYANLTSDQKRRFDEYKLMIYICKGTDKEKLDWFKIINIAGEKLTNQELRNAIYTGKWLEDAKKYFSKRGCKAENLAGDYLTGTQIRQDYLETVLSWIASSEGKTIEQYMAEHQHNDNADDLKEYFERVFEWVTSVFTNNSRARKKLMCGLEWGLYYNEYGLSGLEAKAVEFEQQIVYYLASDDIEKKNGGIYKYLLTGKEKFLSVRDFSPSDRQWAYQKQEGHCPYCMEKGDDTIYEIDEMHADHIVPWSKGGKTVRENCQMLCSHHNLLKSDN